VTRSPLADAFDHHVWATVRLIDVCRGLSQEQLAPTVPGTFGPILPTLRHLVAADASYLYVLGGQRTPLVDAERMDLDELRAIVDGHGAEWARVLAGEVDPDVVLRRLRDDGSESHAPRGVRLAQVLHHGTDHRSQICTALTMLGVPPPDIDVWDFADAQGRLVEVPPST
jgi:uncharacterized damage-inducible protein DinB